MGRFVKGQAKPANSGRKPGVGNRVPARIFADVLEQLEARDFSVIDEAVRLYRSRKTNVEMRVRLLTVLSSIAFPRKLAVASVKKVTHQVDFAALLADPAIAKQMESLSMALEGKRSEAKLLSAPVAPDSDLPILDAEPVDEPGEPGGPAPTGMRL